MQCVGLDGSQEFVCCSRLHRWNVSLLMKTFFSFSFSLNDVLARSKSFAAA